jgi:hypothetical protein
MRRGRCFATRVKTHFLLQNTFVCRALLRDGSVNREHFCDRAVQNSFDIASGTLRRSAFVWSTQTSCETGTLQQHGHHFFQEEKGDILRFTKSSNAPFLSPGFRSR